MMNTSLQRRLTRSAQDRMIGGVAGGLARYFEVDSTLVRLVLVGLFFTGISILLYPILWLVMPPENGAQSSVQPSEGARFDPMTGQPLQPGSPRVQRLSTQTDRQRLLGLLLLGLGALLVGKMIFPWAAALFFPTVLIVIGLMLLNRH